MLALVALTLRFRIESRKVERRFDGELVYSIHRDAQSRLHVVSHIPLAEGKTPLLLLDPAETTEAAPGLRSPSSELRGRENGGR
eukprot:gene8839-10853_t